MENKQVSIIVREDTQYFISPGGYPNSCSKLIVQYEDDTEMVIMLNDVISVEVRNHIVRPGICITHTGPEEETRVVNGRILSYDPLNIKLDTSNRYQYSTEDVELCSIVSIELLNRPECSTLYIKK